MRFEFPVLLLFNILPYCTYFPLSKLDSRLDFLLHCMATSPFTATSGLRAVDRIPYRVPEDMVELRAPRSSTRVWALWWWEWVAYNPKFKSCHPDFSDLQIFRLVVQCSVYTKMRSSGKKCKTSAEKEKFLSDKILQFESGLLSRVEYVKEIFYKFLPGGS